MWTRASIKEGNIVGFASRVVCAASIQLCYYAKVATDDAQANERGCVPINFIYKTKWRSHGLVCQPLIKCLPVS